MARKKAQNVQVVQNSIKTLLANIRFASVDDPVRSLVITSSVPNEGKTTIAAQLASAIAAGGKNVLLVECDMRRRSLAAHLNVHCKAGLHAVLADEAGLAQAVAPVPGQEGLYFLDAEPHIPNPADLLSSKRFGRFIGTVSREFDFVLFDTPPVGTFVDAAILSTLVDATVLVVRDNFTKRGQVKDAYDQLCKAEANVIGVVLNDCEVESSEYYYAYYNKEGKRVKKADLQSQSFAAAPQDSFDMGSDAALPKVPRGSGF